MGRTDLPAALARIKADSKASGKERQALREELANYHAARLIVEDPPQNDLRIVRRIFADRDAEYIKLLASRVISAAPHTIALLASTQQQQSPATVVMACSQELGRNAGELLRAALAHVRRARRRISDAGPGAGALETSSMPRSMDWRRCCAPGLPQRVSRISRQVALLL